MFNWAKSREIRRRSGIVAYVGANGSGKTLAMVHDTLPSLQAGRPVLSTVRLLDWENPRPCEDDECMSAEHPNHGAAHPLWVPLRRWADLLDAESCDVLMDEVTGIASSRDSMALPGVVANMLVQLRRADITLRWTAPNWARADAIIRECTQLAVVCQGFARRQVPGRNWPSSTWVKARALDARDLEDLTAGTVTRSRAVSVGWARVASVEGRLAYQTLDSVMTLPLVQGGRCTDCGGRRTVPVCKCDP